MPLALTSLIGLGADQFPLTWRQAVSFAKSTTNIIIDGESVAAGSNATIAANFTFVQKIKPGAFLAGVGGPYVRMRLTGPSAGVPSTDPDPTTISAVYIGNAATSGDAYSFDGNQTQVTFSGSGSIVLPVSSLASAASVKSDTILPATAIDWTKDVLIALDVTSGSDYRYSTGHNTTNFIAYAKSGVSEASTTDKGASYTSAGSGAGRVNFITGIETAS